MGIEKRVQAGLSGVFENRWTRALVMAVAMAALLCLFGVRCLANGPPAAGVSPTNSAGTSETELSKELANPVSSIWSLSFQQNNYDLQNPHGWNSNLQFQPVLPVALTKEWNLITRPVFQLFNSTPCLSASTNPHTLQRQIEVERTTGFGDTIFLEMLSPAPAIAGNWLLGLGPTFILPTATSNFTGQGKWQAGPGAVVGYLSDKWILGAFVQNWTSIAGDSHRADTNQMNLQPIAVYFFGQGWSVGYSGNVLANWEADSGNVWTVPIGVGVTKVGKFGTLPVKIGLAVQYMPIRPDRFGQKWNIQVQIVPIIPKLIKGTLLCE